MGWQVYSTSILLSPLLRLRFSILLKHFIPVRNKSCHVKTPVANQFCSITSRNSVTLKFGDNSIAIYSLKWSVTPTFLSRNIFYLQLPPYCPEKNKKSRWEDLKISSFLSTRHRILPSCSCKVRDTMVGKCELVLQGTSAVD